MKNSFCIIKDHLGSITSITDASGAIQQELSFDAWGNLRNPTTWSGSFTGTPLIDRGFTGHEHMTTQFRRICNPPTSNISICNARKRDCSIG